MVEDHLEHDGIRIHRHTELAAVLGRGGRVCAVQTDRSLRIDCQVVAVAVGIRPRLELARRAGLASGRGITVDEAMRTSDPDIFAAGDAAEVSDSATGSRTLDSLWWVALAHGRTAGENMAGGRAVIERGVPFNVTRLGGITTTILGTVGQRAEDEDLVAIARGDSNTWREPGDGLTIEDARAQSRLRLLIGPRQILGAVVMGDQALSRILQVLIREAADITPIREPLLTHPEQCGDLLNRFWRSWSGNRHAA
jgi:NADPH-dependent 2,4-dienoyl-CoA reductase/sulfur reductase-like enzyme